MTFAKFVLYIVYLINVMVVPLIFGVSFIVFLWGMVRYYFLSTDDTSRSNAHAFMLWGILGMVLLFSVWGVLNLSLGILGLR